jgi:hypothetical protein
MAVTAMIVLKSTSAKKARAKKLANFRPCNADLGNSRTAVNVPKMRSPRPAWTGGSRVAGVRSAGSKQIFSHHALLPSDTGPVGHD